MNIYCLKDNLSFLRPTDLGSLMRLFSRKTIKCTVQMDNFNSYQDKICVKFPRLSQLFSLYAKSQFQMVEIDSFLHTLICLLQNSVLCESAFHSLIQILKNLDSQHKVVRKQSQTICPMALSQEYPSLVLHWQRGKKGSENSWVPGISSSPIQSEYTSASQGTLFRLSFQTVFIGSLLWCWPAHDVPHVFFHSFVLICIPPTA